MERQKKLHRMLRSKITKLRSSGLLNGAVLTYHGDVNSLYCCLDVPSVELFDRSIFLSEEAIKKIPIEIKNLIKEAVKDFDPISERLEIIDYELELARNGAPFAYGLAPIVEILNFASKGTDIALEILDDDKTIYQKWTGDNEIAEHIKKQIEKLLETPRERWHVLHFVCNPLGVVDVCTPSGVFRAETYIRNIWSKPTEADSRFFLQKLYDWNEIT
jgi:hypothetical protein